MELSLTSTIDDITRRVGVLANHEMKQAVMRSLNRAADGVLTDSGREIRARYDIKLADVKKVMGVAGRASMSNLRAIVRARGHRIPVFLFNPKPNEPDPGHKRGPVTVSIKKGKRGGGASWFVARMRSGHIGVFRRDPSKTMKGSDKRQAIREVMTIAVAEMLNSREITRIVSAQGIARFTKELERLIKVQLKGGF